MRAVIATVGALSMSLAMSPVWVNGSVAAAGATAAIGRWHVTGTMNTARRAATATGLPTGRVLVAGGYGCPPTDVCSSAELYDPRTGKWHPTGGMAMGRAGHTATLLRNGRVLVAGGNGCTPLNVCSTAELYDPATGRWAATGSMSTARWAHTATLLRSGQVLVAGGYFCPPVRLCASAELYDPLTGTWRLTGRMTTARWDHSATLLQSGQVLVAGGEGCIPSYLCASAELYDPATGRWHRTTSMSTARAGHTATLLPNGQVLVTGGYGCPPVYVCSSAELYDPRAGTWHLTGEMAIGRAGHTATLLPNGQVLVTGGYGCTGSGCRHLASAELYDPASGTWQPAGSIGSPREYPTATLIPNGQVLVAGGSARCPLSGCIALATATLYTPDHGRPQGPPVVARRFGYGPNGSAFRCDMTPIHAIPLRGNGIPGTPWVQAEPASSGITGHLFFGNRLLHTDGWMPDDGTTKTYWRLADGQTGIEISGRNLSLGRSALRMTFANGILVVPTPGCWQLDLQSGTARGHVTLVVLGD